MRAPVLPLLTLLLPLAACTDTGDKDADEGEATSSESDGEDGASDGTDGGESDGDDGAGADCEVRLIGHEPADGAVNIDLERDVFLQFSGPLEDAAGWTAEISPGISHGTIIDDEDGTTLTLTTAGLLEADTVYTVSTEVCGSAASFAFTTVEGGGGEDGGEDGGGGDGIDVPNDDLIGNTYSLDLASATWHEPSTLGAFLGNIFQDPLLFGVTDADGDDLWVSIATTAQGSGSSGVLTVDTVTEIGRTSFADSPLLVTNPTDLTLTYSGVDIPVESLGLSVTFAEDGSELVSARATALGDTRNVGAALGLGSGPDSLCVTLDSLGVSCVSCSDGQPLCMEMDLTVENAPLEGGLSL